jgi:hypothetical protein
VSALLVVAALGLAGCGGDDEAEPAANEPPAIEEQAPSKAEVIGRADAICTQTKVVIDMARTRFHHGNFDQASEAELADFVRGKLVPAYRSELTSLGKLAAEGGGSDDLDQIVASGEEATEALADDPAKVSPVGGSSLFDEANQLASDYGLSVCVAP